MRLIAATIGLSLLSASASAAPITYTSRAAFDAALASAAAAETTETFQSIDPALVGSTIGGRAAGRFVATVGALTLDSARQLNVLGPASAIAISTSFAATTTGTLILSTAAPSIAFGLDLRAIPGPITLSALGRAYQLTAPGFFGVIDAAAAATTATFSTAAASANAFDFDNVSTAIGRAAAVPEPASAALLAIFLFGAGCRRTRTADLRRSPSA